MHVTGNRILSLAKELGATSAALALVYSDTYELVTIRVDLRLTNDETQPAHHILWLTTERLSSFGSPRPRTFRSFDSAIVVALELRSALERAGFSHQPFTIEID